MNIDLEAIAHCLNQSLTFDGIIAKVSVKNDCLKIVLESVAVTKKDQLLPIIMREIAHFKLTSIKTVKIYGKQIKTFDPNWYHNFGLYSQNNYDYSQSNKSKNNTNTSNYQVEIPKGKISQTEFEEALIKCSQTAKSAYNRSSIYAHKIESAIKKLNSYIIAINYEILNRKGADKFQFATTLKQIQLDIKALSEDSLEDLVISLDKKRKHLKNFTVALFGRTKAGKSTLRETLTRGNGSTIGKGSQRTTREVKEYSWQGLRLLDTPGIEAFQGDDDTEKANDIIDQSDIILFLTSDDSVQPGEFQAMAQLQQINKYFAVILNVKHDIANNLEDLQMFLDPNIPDMVFDEDRLSQHKHHIQSHIQEYLNLDNVDIVPIHAQSGFLSTKSEYQEYSSQLWELSKIEELYSLIAYQIYNNGQNLRLSTFADSLDYFIVLINQKLNTAKDELSKQLKFIHDKKQELEKIFTEVKKDGNFQIKSECESLYNRIENQIGNFVDKYSDMDISARKQEWQKIVNQRNIERSMKCRIDEILLNLGEKLKEFEQEYKYDVNNIKIDLENLNIRDISKGNTGKLIQRATVAVGLVFLAANWWNPGGWVVAGGLAATGVVGVAGDWKSKEDDKNYKKDIQEEKDSLRKQVMEKRQLTVKAYQDWLFKNINQYEEEVIGQVKSYIKRLSEIVEKLDYAINDNLKIQRDMKKDFSNFK
jgi:tRNA U34 5-carboxymethylaminomethyl modifying GTPase MnmE/TrmE